MRKKLLVALLAVVMLLSLTACSGGEIDMSKVKAKSLMGSSEATIRWRFGTSTAPPPGHYVSGLVKFQELIGILIQIFVFPPRDFVISFHRLFPP